jgi:acyl dehydratase
MIDLQVGQCVSVRRAFRQEDFDRFAALSGDDNPIHVDPAFSARTKFGRTVAHGMLLYSAVGGVIGSHLPGPGTVQLKQELMFPSPTYGGEEVDIRVEVDSVSPEEGEAELITVVVRPDDNVGLEGRTRVRLPGARLGMDSPSQEVNPVEAVGVPFKGFELHQRAETRRIFTTGDLAEYAALAGDANPIFTDFEAAHRRGFNGLIVPGSLLGSLFSDLLGTELPGRGTNYLKQGLSFPIPAMVDQELTASVEIIRLRPEKQLVNLRTVCTNPDGEIVCSGEALVLVSDVERR